MVTMISILGDFVHRLGRDDLPPEVLDRAKTCLLYAIGIGLAGSEIEFARIAWESTPRCPGPATVLPGGERTCALDAALVNSILFHSRTQEDTYAPGSAHPGAVVVPAALAVAESQEEAVPGNDFLAAVVCGYEVIAGLSRACAPFSTPRGFRATPVYGIFGSAAAAARLLRLGASEAASCLSFAANMAAGVTNSFYEGSMEWHFQVGFAARNGILAALLAQKGAAGSLSSLDGRSGFLQAFTGSREPAGEISRTFVPNGDYSFSILDVDFKPYPTCAWVIPSIDVARQIRRQSSVDPAQVEKVLVYLNPYEAAYPGNSYQGPFPSVESATMSAPYCVALALLDGHVTLRGLMRHGEEAIHHLAQKVQVIPSEERPRMTCRLEVYLHDGSVIHRLSADPPDRYRYGWDRTRNFLEELLPEMPGVDSRVLSRLADQIQRLDRAADVRGLLTGVLGGQRGSRSPMSS